MLLSIGIGGAGVRVCLSYRRFRIAENKTQIYPSILVETDPKSIPRAYREPNSESSTLKTPKVVVQVIAHNKTWVHAFQGLKKGIVDMVLRNVTEIMLAQGSFDGLLVFHSLQGSTGGGLGSAILEALRTSFNDLYIASIAIDSKSASPISRINRAMTLLWTNRLCDVIFYFQNELMERLLCYGTQRTSAETLSRINSHIASLLCATFSDVQVPLEQGLPDLSQLVSTLCPVRQMNVLLLCSGSASAWEDNSVLPKEFKPHLAWGRAAQSLSASVSMWTRNRRSGSARSFDAELAGGVEDCVALQLSFAGEIPPPEKRQHCQHVLKKLEDSFRLVTWNHDVWYFRSHTNRRVVSGMPKEEPFMKSSLAHGKVEVVAAVNSISFGKHLFERLSDSAKQLHEVGAFCHFFKSGDCSVDFEQVFTGLKNTVHVYEQFMK